MLICDKCRQPAAKQETKIQKVNAHLTGPNLNFNRNMDLCGRCIGELQSVLDHTLRNFTAQAEPADGVGANATASQVAGNQK